MIRGPAAMSGRQLKSAVGWPVAFSELLARRSTPSFDPSGPEIRTRSRIARQTVTSIEPLEKKPLSVSFDKLGNNATVAMVHTRRLSTAGQLGIAPFDEPGSRKGGVTVRFAVGTGTVMVSQKAQGGTRLWTGT